MNAETPGPTAADRYRIRVRGRLDPRWSLWLAGMTIKSSEGVTVLEGSLRDQAELHGLLARLRDAGLPLLAVIPIDNDPATTYHHHHQNGD